MPTPPYATALVSVNGATAVAGGVSGVAVGATLQLSPESSIGWRSCRWELYATPPGYALPAGWTADDEFGSVTGFPNAPYYAASGTGFTPPAITLTPWGKILWRLRVNEALDGDPNPNLTDMTGGASAPSPVSGLVDIAPFEQSQFGGWDQQLQANLRDIDTAFGNAGSSLPTGQADVLMGDADYVAGTAAANEITRPMVKVSTSTPFTAMRKITFNTPSTDAGAEERTVVFAGTGADLEVAMASGASVQIPPGGSMKLRFDTTGVYPVVTTL